MVRNRMAVAVFPASPGSFRDGAMFVESRPARQRVALYRPGVCRNCGGLGAMGGSRII
jgi:hypothetical protein